MDLTTGMSPLMVVLVVLLIICAIVWLIARIRPR